VLTEVASVTNNCPADELNQLSEERRFMEELTNARFNFFLVFVAGIIVAVVTTQDHSLRQWLCWFGIVVSFFLSLTIYRSHRKLDLIFEALRKHKEHPFTYIDEKYKQRQGPQIRAFWAQWGCRIPWLKRAPYLVPSVRWIIGWFIPLGCLIALVLLSCNHKLADSEEVALSKKCFSSMAAQLAKDAARKH